MEDNDGSDSEDMPSGGFLEDIGIDKPRWTPVIGPAKKIEDEKPVLKVRMSKGGGDGSDVTRAVWVEDEAPGMRNSNERRAKWDVPPSRSGRNGEAISLRSPSPTLKKSSSGRSRRVSRGDDVFEKDSGARSPPAYKQLHFFEFENPHGKHRMSQFNEEQRFRKDLHLPDEERFRKEFHSSRRIREESPHDRRHKGREPRLMSPLSRKREHSGSPGRYMRPRWELSPPPVRIVRRSLSVSPPSRSHRRSRSPPPPSRRGVPSGSHDWSPTPPPPPPPSLPPSHHRRPVSTHYVPRESDSREVRHVRDWGSPPHVQAHGPVYESTSHQIQHSSSGYDTMSGIQQPVYSEGGYMPMSGSAPYSNSGVCHDNYQSQDYGNYNYYQQQPISAPYMSHNQQDYNTAGQASSQTTWQNSSSMSEMYGETPASGGSAAAGSHSASAINEKTDEAKKQAIRNELLNQQKTLAEQRDEYASKAASLTRELNMLKQQEQVLLKDNSEEKKHYLDENSKLQREISNRISAINNVVDMLTGIIGDRKEFADQEKRKKKKKSKKQEPDVSGESEASENVAEPPVPEERNPSTLTAPTSTVGSKQRFNLVYYDPEMHWCHVCDVFPHTAKEYLNHLHSNEHKQNILERKLTDLPWHKTKQVEQILPTLEGLPSKRTPIRGENFIYLSSVISI